MGGVIKMLITLFLAVLAGTYTADYVLDGRIALLTKQIGAWQTWRLAGIPATDPYTRGYFVNSERLPLSRFEMVEFRAARDDEGRLLNPSCVYTLSGQMPVARRWSLIASPFDADTVTPQVHNIQLLSEHAIYQPDDKLKVMVSPEATPGNWLETDPRTEFELIMQIYNPVYSAGRDEYTVPVFSIKRERCL